MKKSLLACALSLVGILTATAQSTPTHDMYVDKGYVGLETMLKVLPTWTPGAAASADAQYVDDNFYICRVPQKTRFHNVALQANADLNDDNAKNLCWWAPIGELTKKWGPLERWNFDGDNFNMWQYVNIHGNWSNSWWRVPGSFNCVAHRNGVRTGCLLFIDWGTSVNTSSGIGAQINTLCTKQDGKYIYAEKMIDYLRYYGIDGIGINPEGNWQNSLGTEFKAFLSECHRIADEKGWPFHVEWYAYVTNSGGLSDNSCSLTDANDTWFHDKTNNRPVTDVFFLNYNWTASGLNRSANTAKSLGRSSFDVYAGFDQQGRGFGKYGNAGWKALMQYPVSIVVWGAHDRSQLYANSTEGGTSDKAIQSEYQTKQEMLFTGGTRNVLNRPEITDDNVTGSYDDLKNWHGYASAVREESTLSELPFVTRFNLGNGAMLNDRGVTTNAHKWYNIGMQDMLPTWRWWIDNGDGKTAPSDGIEMDFTFDDAWFGGSCLKAHGATTRSDVRLFETKWGVTSTSDLLSLTFKPSTTEGNMRLMLSKTGTETTFTYIDIPVTTPGAWNTVTLTAAECGLTLSDEVACVGLSFTNTPANYSTLLGEMSYIPDGFVETPVQPVITHAEVLKRYYNRTDFKVVWNVPFDGVRKPEYEGCPIYNEEVGTWYYEVYVRQGDKQTLVATTPSWASYVVEAPITAESPTYRIGVRAVGRDGVSKSDIAWTEEMESPLDIIDEVTIDKEVIKPFEAFTIGFEDPNHSAAYFRILDAMTGEVVAEQENTLTLNTALSAVGSYDVEVTTNGKTDMHRDMILVSKEETGRTPMVDDLKCDNEKAYVGEDTPFTANVIRGDTYNGEPCTVSRSLYMQSPYQLTIPADVLTSTEYRNVTYALWFKVQEFSHQSYGTLLMTKVNRNYGGTWTEDVWGEMWTAIRPAGYGLNGNIARDNADNEISVSIHGPKAGTSNYQHNKDVDLLTDGYSIRPNTWYHCCVVVTGQRITLYLNGKKVATALSRGAEPKYWNGANFYVGGSMTNLASFTGWVDEVQIWNKSLSANEVLKCMNGYDPDNIPTNLRGYFTFEEQATDEDGYLGFPNLGNQQAVKYAHMTTTSSSTPLNNLTTALGTPALTGSFPVVYEGTQWTGGLLRETTDTTASICLQKEGANTVTATVANSWGTHTKSRTVTTGIDGDTGIESVTEGDTHKGTANTALYDLQGCRVKAPVHGHLYIQGGQKILWK